MKVTKLCRGENLAAQCRPQRPHRPPLCGRRCATALRWLRFQAIRGEAVPLSARRDRLRAHSCPKQFQQIVREADDLPFGGDFFPPPE